MGSTSTTSESEADSIGAPNRTQIVKNSTNSSGRNSYKKQRSKSERSNNSSKSTSTVIKSPERRLSTSNTNQSQNQNQISSSIEKIKSNLYRHSLSNSIKNDVRIQIERHQSELLSASLKEKSDFTISSNSKIPVRGHNNSNRSASSFRPIIGRSESSNFLTRESSKTSIDPQDIELKKLTEIVKNEVKTSTNTANTANPATELEQYTSFEKDQPESLTKEQFQAKINKLESLIIDDEKFNQEIKASPESSVVKPLKISIKTLEQDESSFSITNSNSEQSEQRQKKNKNNNRPTTAEYSN